MELPFNTLKTFFATVGNQPTFWIAYSGGIDSLVLLHASTQLRNLFDLKLHAIHIDHGLSPQAKDWALHCKKTCQVLNVNFSSFSIEVKPDNKRSLEELARQKRYAMFCEQMKPGDFLLTAHHREDQAETVMLQLLRGAGPKGLAGMPVQKKLGEGVQARPFLHIDQTNIQSYAKYHHLQWIEDESNQNRDFSRNFLRHEVFPILKKHWPGMTKSLARVAQHAAGTESFIADVAKQHFDKLYDAKDGTLNQTLLLQLPQTMQAHVLRYWMQHQAFPLPSNAKMQTILESFLKANVDKNPYVHWGNVELRRYQDRLYLSTKIPQHPFKQQYLWDLKNPLELPTIGKLIATPVEGRGFAPELTVKVGFRQGGERCQLPGRNGRHTLKHLFQTWGVPPWMRDRIPLLYVEETLAAVIGYYFNQDFQVFDNKVGYLVTLI